MKNRCSIIGNAPLRDEQGRPFGTKDAPSGKCLGLTLGSCEECHALYSPCICSIRHSPEPQDTRGGCFDAQVPVMIRRARGPWKKPRYTTKVKTN